MAASAAHGLSAVRMAPFHSMSFKGAFTGLSKEHSRLSKEAVKESPVALGDQAAQKRLDLAAQKRDWPLAAQKRLAIGD